MSLFKLRTRICIVVFSVLSVVAAIFSMPDDVYNANTSSNVLDLFYDTVIIDPGHGGVDSGAVGNMGTFEKDINLSVSRIIYSLFSCTDVDAVLTRSCDELLYDEENKSQSIKTQDLANRVAFVKQYNAPLFVSIHQNKFPIKKYSGLQVYYSKNSPESKFVAENIQKTTRSLLQNDNKREIKKAGSNIYVLKNIYCPAVLVECGFLSNPDEEELLCDYSYQKKLAICIFSSLLMTS